MTKPIKPGKPIGKAQGFFSLTEFLEDLDQAEAEQKGQEPKGPPIFHFFTKAQAKKHTTTKLPGLYWRFDGPGEEWHGPFRNHGLAQLDVLKHI